MTNTQRSLRIFLCHSSGDKPAVQKLYARLTADGIDAWLDTEKLIPGQNWQTEISQAVRNSDAVVVCLSSQSVTKEGFVQKEIKFALDVAEEKLDSTIFIIPARLEMCDVPERINKFHWVDLFSDDGYEWLIKALRIRADSVGATIRHKKRPSKSPQAQKSQPRTREQIQQEEVRVTPIKQLETSARSNDNYVQEIKIPSGTQKNTRQETKHYSFLSLFKSLALNFIIGFGLFSLDKQSKRKWIYPLAIIGGFISYIVAGMAPAQFHGFGWDIGSIIFSFIVWGISFIDIIFSWVTDYLRSDKR